MYMYKQYRIQKYKSKQRGSAGWPENKEWVGSGGAGSRQGDDDDGGGKQMSGRVGSRRGEGNDAKTNVKGRGTCTYTSNTVYKTKVQNQTSKQQRGSTGRPENEDVVGSGGVVSRKGG